MSQQFFYPITQNISIHVSMGSCFLPLLIQMQFILMHYIAGNPSFYKQAKERGNLILILEIRDIYVVIILAIKF